MYKIGKIYFLFALNNYAFSGIEKIVIIYELTFLHKSSTINMFTSTPVRQREGLRRCMELRNDSAGQRDDCADHNPVLQDGFWQ